MNTDRLIEILRDIAAETAGHYQLSFTADEGTLVAVASSGRTHHVHATFTPHPELRAFGASFAYVDYTHTCEDFNPSELRRRASEQEDLLALIDSAFVRAHEEYHTRTRDTLHAILADLSDEGPELFAYIDVVGGETSIIASVSDAGGASAEATLPVSKLDLHCVCDAKIEYEHPDGPLPSNATPERLESRARLLRHLEDRLEKAFNRIAVAEECGSLQPN